MSRKNIESLLSKIASNIDARKEVATYKEIFSNLLKPQPIDYNPETGKSKIVRNVKAINVIQLYPNESHANAYYEELESSIDQYLAQIKRNLKSVKSIYLRNSTLQLSKKCAMLQ